MQQLEIKGSSSKGLKVLVLDNNESRLADIETRAALDPDLQRLNIYVASSISEATDHIRRYGISLTIYSDGVDQRDFVALQLELKKANPKIDLIALVSQPTLRQYRESKLAGNIVDFETPAILSKWEDLRDLILSYIENIAKKDFDQDIILTNAEQIQRAYSAIDTEVSNFKSDSKAITANLIRHFDLSTNECLKLFASERIYLPRLTAVDYKVILGGDQYSLFPILKDTASWEIANSKPNSVQGLIITAANFIAHRIYSGDTLESLLTTIDSRPDFLKHQAIRVLSHQVIIEALSTIDRTIHSSGVVNG